MAGGAAGVDGATVGVPVGVAVVVLGAPVGLLALGAATAPGDEVVAGTSAATSGAAPESTAVRLRRTAVVAPSAAAGAGAWPPSGEEPTVVRAESG
jgi:hypothetical protein